MLFLNQYGNNIYINSRVIRNDSTTNQDGMFIGYANTGGAAGHLRFYANSTNERMRIDAVGNVGIANTTPQDKLAVTGTAYVSGNIAVGGILTDGYYYANGTPVTFGGGITIVKGGFSDFASAVKYPASNHF